MTRWGRIALLGALVWLIGGPGATQTQDRRGKESLTLSVSPVYSYEGGRIRYRVQVPYHAKNAALCQGYRLVRLLALPTRDMTGRPVEAVPICRLSCQALTEASPQWQQFEWGQYPIFPGEYRALVFLYRWAEDHASIAEMREAPFQVLPGIGRESADIELDDVHCRPPERDVVLRVER